MLRDTLARLSSEFASQIFAALRSASLDELAELSGRRPPEAASSASEPAAPKPARRSPSKRRTEERADSSELTSAALEFFAERGAKGATAVQLSEHLKRDDATDVIATLASSGVVRDAGIRRATGKGTAIVYVLSA